MSKLRRLAAGFIATAATLTVVTVATQNSASANPDNPTFITGSFGKVSTARAYNVAAAGLLNISPTTEAKCSHYQTKDRTAVNVSIPGVLKVNGLTTHCDNNYNGSVASATAKAADIDLFNGKIRITALDAYCFRSPYFGGVATVGATYGSLVTDFNYSKNGSGAIVIPGLATVAVNVKNIGNSTAFADLVVVTLLNTGQVIVISACELKHQSLLG